jgi:putative ATPase
MADLFDAPESPRLPLAEAMRPQTIAEVIGQKHLLGPGKPLALAFQSGKLHSMILWGPPGLARRRSRGSWRAPSTPSSRAVGGVLGRQGHPRGDRPGRGRAARGRHTILFVDEVHRFNKAQQDAFCPTSSRAW